jgi:FkbM family methyltransferase
MDAGATTGARGPAVAYCSVVTATSAHHPVFERYARWAGEVPDGYTADFLGVTTRTSFYLTREQLRNVGRADGPVTPELPLFNEEYFEWVDVLEAVQQAAERFTMVELGAGWGRWLGIGAAAAKQRGLSSFLVGVEAEPSHYRWMAEHLRDNGIADDGFRLHEAAVAGEDGSVSFHIGDPVAWYGQAIDPYSSEADERSVDARLRGLPRRGRHGPSSKRRLQRVSALSLRTVLDGLDLVDLIDLDVQGVEAEVLEGGKMELDEKVKRVHVGTHSVENEERCRALFGRLGWINRNDFPSGSELDTEYGRISFQDGVQTWINLRLNDDVRP